MSTPKVIPFDRSAEIAAAHRPPPPEVAARFLPGQSMGFLPKVYQAGTVFVTQDGTLYVGPADRPTLAPDGLKVVARSLVTNHGTRTLFIEKDCPPGLREQLKAEVVAAAAAGKTAAEAGI